MARIADPNSKRQRAWALIEEKPNLKRAQMLAIFMDDLDVSKGYANTLFESYRIEQKAQGTFVETYIVRDVKDGYIVDPYISTKFVHRTTLTKESPVTVKKAVTVYRKEIRERLEVARTLQEPVVEEE